MSSSSRYGRGAEIWPEGNNDRILLRDSFPGGIVPPDAVVHDDEWTHAKTSSSSSLHDTAAVAGVHDVTTTTTTTPTRRRRRRPLPRTIERILTNAAIKEEEDNVGYNSDTSTTTAITKTPAIIALVLLVLRLVPPMDILLVIFFSGYFTMLTMTSQMMRPMSFFENGSTTTAPPQPPILPSLPPQGHVPSLVSNPLGHVFTNSNGYDMWLRFGSWISLFAPLGLLGWYCLVSLLGIMNETATVGSAAAAASRLCARPLFLLSCQALSESIVRRVMAPLPIRILVPIAYNTIRLVPLWNWAVTPMPSTTMPTIVRLLAILNLIYWFLNLFGFLLPVASLRYMRAHFFNVEAEQVTIRRGMENSIGLL